MPESIHIYGTQGSIFFSGGKITSSTIESVQKELANTAGDSGSGASDPMAITDQFHQAVIKDMIEVVTLDKKPKVDLQEAKKSVALINAIYKSNGNAVLLKSLK